MTSDYNGECVSSPRVIFKYKNKTPLEPTIIHDVCKIKYKMNTLNSMNHDRD